MVETVFFFLKFREKKLYLQSASTGKLDGLEYLTEDCFPYLNLSPTLAFFCCHFWYFLTCSFSVASITCDLPNIYHSFFPIFHSFIFFLIPHFFLTKETKDFSTIKFPFHYDLQWASINT